MKQSVLQSRCGERLAPIRGHGTHHTAMVSYSQMQTQMGALGYDNVFVGTVEGDEAFSAEAIIEAVSEAGYTKVVLRPLMIAAVWGFLLLSVLLAGCLRKDSKETAVLPDGIYTAEFDTDNSMFHVNEAYEGKGTLTVEDGEMTIHISLGSKRFKCRSVVPERRAYHLMQAENPVWICAFEYSVKEFGYLFYRRAGNPRAFGKGQNRRGICGNRKSYGTV